MNALVFTRVAFVACATFIGYQLGLKSGLPGAGPFAAFVLSLLFVVLELGTDILPAHKLFMATVGLTFGLYLGGLVSEGLLENIMNPELAPIAAKLLFGYFSVVFALKYADRIDFSRFAFLSRMSTGNTTILDTSVIVDGRIKDLIETQFIRGGIVVPSFVIYELQALADSQDPRKRAKGRQGLETLEIVKAVNESLTVYEQDYPDISDVDLKLIQLAKDINGEILTTDFNLYKIALLHQVRALNINQLANVLKPNVNIGEALRVIISKEGKEPGQGVAYLEDGTMVVVDNAAEFMNQEINCTITQILPTSAGRMIFAKPIHDMKPVVEGTEEDELERRERQKKGRIRTIARS